MQLSIVILNYNVRYFLELCLQSVEAATQNIDSEIIVIDNNSPDDSCEMVRQLFPEVILIENIENLGFSKANNQAVMAANGTYVCILNPDTMVTENTFTDILNFAKSKDNLGIIGCRLIDGTGKFLPESKRNIPVVKIAVQKIRGNSSNYYANQIGEKEIAKVAVLVGAFMFLKRDTFRVLNGFDEDYFMYGEDIDLSYKAIKKGYDNYYFGKTSIVHFKGESTLKDASQAKRFYGAMQIFYKKHFKSNLLFDTIVWCGIKLALLVRTKPELIQQVPDFYYVLTNNKSDVLKKGTNKEFIKVSDLKNIEKNSLLTFDTDSVSFEQIVKNMSQLEVNMSLLFRFLPKSKKYIIGSDCSYNRGEIDVF